MTYDLGDGVNLDRLVYDRDDELAAATVALTVTKPSGTTITPVVSTPSLGHYRAATFTADAAGPWSYAWVVSGAVVDVSTGYFVVADPAPEPYCSLPDFKKWLKLDDDDTFDDDLAAEVLESVSREIEDVCGRSFYRELTATARTFDVEVCGFLEVDDFWSTTGLIIGGTAYSSSTWKLLPRNGVVSGRRGWPTTSIRPKSGSLTVGTEMEITARWGWESQPAPVHEACRIAAADTLGLKDARFGVAGFGQYGAVRVRGNAMVMAKLQPYMRDIMMAA